MPPVKLWTFRRASDYKKYNDDYWLLSCHTSLSSKVVFTLKYQGSLYDVMQELATKSVRPLHEQMLQLVWMTNFNNYHFTRIHTSYNKSPSFSASFSQDGKTTSFDIDELTPLTRHELKDFWNNPRTLQAKEQLQL